MSFIEFRDVTKDYRIGEVVIHALSGVNFALEKGQFVIIAGASGAGKSTILNILGGMDTSTSGHILVDGRRIDDFNEKQLTDYRRYDIGFVFQFYNLVQNLTALENVELAAQICKDPLDAATVLKQVGLELMFMTPEKGAVDNWVTAVELAKMVELPVDVVKKKLNILKDKDIVRVKGINPKYWKFDDYNFQRMDEDDEVYKLLCCFDDVDFDKYFQY